MNTIPVTRSESQSASSMALRSDFRGGSQVLVKKNVARTTSVVVASPKNNPCSFDIRSSRVAARGVFLR
jgi:hypothetical protein